MNKNTQSEVCSKQQKFQVDYNDGFAEDFDADCNRGSCNHLYKIEQIGETFFQKFPSSETGYDFMELGSGTGIHYRTGNDVLRKLIPYQSMEKYSVLDPMAIMFLSGANAK